MSTWNRVVSGMVAFLAMIGMFTVTATPAQAWSYCDPNGQAGGAAPTNKVSVYPGQGYCGHRYGFTMPTSGSWPRRLDLRYTSTGNLVDYAGSAWNRTAYYVKFYPAVSCTGSPTVTLAPFTSHPNFAKFINDDGYWAYRNHACVAFWP